MLKWLGECADAQESRLVIRARAAWRQIWGMSWRIGGALPGLQHPLHVADALALDSAEFRMEDEALKLH